MAESLNPTLLSRISQAMRPDFARTVRARRIAAALLVVLAAVAAWRPDPGRAPRMVVVAVRDLSPGTLLTADDVELRDHPSVTVPDGAATDLATVVGAILAGPSRRGEVLTDARVLGSRLTRLSAGPDGRVVPLHLADAAVADLVRPGDRVDVLGAPAADADATPPCGGNQRGGGFGVAQTRSGRGPKSRAGGITEDVPSSVELRWRPDELPCVNPASFRPPCRWCC